MNVRRALVAASVTASLVVCGVGDSGGDSSQKPKEDPREVNRRLDAAIEFIVERLEESMDRADAVRGTKPREVMESRTPRGGLRDSVGPTARDFGGRLDPREFLPKDR